MVAFHEEVGLLPTVAGESLSRNKIPETQQPRRLRESRRRYSSRREKSRWYILTVSAAILVAGSRLFREFGRLLERFAGARQAIDLPGSDGPEQFVRLKLLGQGDEPALLPSPNMQPATRNDLQEVDFRDR